jgi:hypothetical protein
MFSIRMLPNSLSKESFHAQPVRQRGTVYVEYIGLYRTNSLKTLG